MNCVEARDEFSALLDGELSPEMRDAVEAHLAQCEACRGELDALRRVDALYRELVPQQAPADLEQRIAGAIRPGAVVEPRRRLLPLEALVPFWLALEAAAVLLVVAGAVFLHFGLRKPSTELAKAPTATSAPAAATDDLNDGLRVAEPGLDVSTGKLDAGKQVSAGDTQQEKLELKEQEAGKEEWAGADKKDIRDREDGKDNDDRGHKAVPAASAAPSAPRLAPPPSAKAVPPALPSAPPSPAAPATSLPKALPAAPSAPRLAPPPPAKPAPTPVPEELPPMDINGDGTSEALSAGQEVAAKAVELVEKRVGTRDFGMRDGVWTQKEYAGEKTSELRRGTANLRRILRRHADLAEVLALGERVVFRVNTTWYRVGSAEKK